jgi:hypothetical protein
MSHEYQTGVPFREAPTVLAVLALVALAPVAMVSSRSNAHHSQAMFDMTQCRSIQGTIRTFEFQFPHSWLWVNVPNPKSPSGVDAWAFEASAPANMTQIEKRWTRNVVTKGDKVVVKYSPMKDGRNAGALAWLTLADGKTTLRAATPACVGVTAPESVR